MITQSTTCRGSEELLARVAAARRGQPASVQHGELLPSTSVDHPTVDRLVEVEGARNGHVGLDVGETRLLQRAVRSHIECIRFTEELLQLQNLEIEFDGLADALHANPL